MSLNSPGELQAACIYLAKEVVDLATSIVDENASGPDSHMIGMDVVDCQVVDALVVAGPLSGA
ncbi:hypothetical protein, partial [Sinosporangium album]|uniref:hypothetical protein n=1 Tax=Sinosporangium album TaxID=504805 RepID=UPI001C409591